MAQAEAGHKRVARGFSVGKPRSDAALALLLSAGLGACEATRSFERAADGSILYLDELSEAQKAYAREATVVRS